jgi:hypothetical protein
MFDGAPSLHGPHHRRDHLQELVRNPESLYRIFLQEYLKENYNRLWNIFESLNR